MIAGYPGEELAGQRWPYVPCIDPHVHMGLEGGVLALPSGNITPEVVFINVDVWIKNLRLSALILARRLALIDWLVRASAKSWTHFP